MADKTEHQEYIEICQDEKIQDIFIAYYKCKWRDGDYCGIKNITVGNIDDCKNRLKCDNAYYLPTIDQLIEMLGDKFSSLIHQPNGDWGCAFKVYPEWVEGQSARIALVKSVREVLNGR